MSVRRRRFRHTAAAAASAPASEGMMIYLTVQSPCMTCDGSVCCIPRMHSFWLKNLIYTCRQQRAMLFQEELYLPRPASSESELWWQPVWLGYAKKWKFEKNFLCVWMPLVSLFGLGSHLLFTGCSVLFSKNSERETHIELDAGAANPVSVDDIYSCSIYKKKERQSENRTRMYMYRKRWKEKERKTNCWLLTSRIKLIPNVLASVVNGSNKWHTSNDIHIKYKHNIHI